MKRTLIALCSAGLMTITAVGGAWADQPTGFEPNPNTNAFASDNYIAYESAIWQHNGLVVSGQDRQTDIKSLQAMCNLAGNN
jgi:hypothetical protein